MKESCVCDEKYMPEGERGCSKREVSTIYGADKKSAIGIYLREHHRGKANAVHSQELEQLFAMEGRSLRRKISALRQDGVPICSDETGYYYADNQQEINKTVWRLNELVTGVSNARTGLLFASLLPATVNIDVTIYMEGSV